MDMWSGEGEGGREGSEGDKRKEGEEENGGEEGRTGGRKEESEATPRGGNPPLIALTSLL
jgi:hypothetical protein